MTVLGLVDSDTGSSAPLSANAKDALDAAAAPAASNPFATIDDLLALLTVPSAVDTPVFEDGVLTIDLLGRRDSYHEITLDQAADSVVVSNAPADGPVRAYLRIHNPSAYAFPITAWATVGATARTWITDYYIHTDSTPTNIEMLSLDGFDTVELAGNAPLEMPPITISTNTTLAWSTHGGRQLKCTAAVTLTVDASTDLPDGETIEIDAVGGDVTLAESSSTINSVGGLLTVSQYGAGLLTGRGTDTYTLVGTLE